MQGERTLRRAVPNDEEVLRTVRLQALSDTPEAFGSTYENELARTPADWRRWLENGAIFFVEDRRGVLGIVCGVPDPSDPAIVHLMSMWVAAAIRGSGAADELTAALLAWAQSAGAKHVRLKVIETNGRARRFYERIGFRTTGRRSVRERDGLGELEMEHGVGDRLRE
jgi:ribosomal protein S18 acetylase RimI-like enzyme